MSLAPLVFTLGGGIVSIIAYVRNQARAGSSALRTSAPTAASRPLLRADNSLALSTIPAHPVSLSQVPDDVIDVTRSPRQAADELYSYVTPLIRNGQGSALGTKGEPNSIVEKAQRDMRMPNPDGIYGADTRKRGRELLGREFPAREPKTAAQPLRIEPKPSPTPASKARVNIGPAVLETPKTPPIPAAAAPAAPPPPASTPVPTASPREAAAALLAYLTSGRAADWGSKAKPSAIVRSAQHDMGKVTADGVYGPATRARGKELLGKPFPPRS